MIATDFIYCRPESKEEAADAYARLHALHKKPLYYSGGSEIITMCRAGSIAPGAVIDLKNIAELNLLGISEGNLVIGAAITLTQLKESRLFPLLGTAAGRIADHTNQCRITIGGNICGTLLYREALLPLLLADAKATVFGPMGSRTLKLRDICRERLYLANGEFICHLSLAPTFTQADYAHIKKTAGEKIDYPLLSLAALFYEDQLRLALSGICRFPFRSAAIEAALNERSISRQERAERIVQLLPETPRSDRAASGSYRAFVLRNTLLQVMERFAI